MKQEDDSPKTSVPLAFTLTAAKCAQLSPRDKLLVENLELIEFSIPQLVPPPPRRVKLVALQCQNCRASSRRTLSHVRKWDCDIQYFLPHLTQCRATPKQVRNTLKRCVKKSSTRRADKSLTKGKLSLNEYCDHLVDIYGLKDNRSVVVNKDGSHSLTGITGVIYGPCDYEAEALPSARHPPPDDTIFISETPDVDLPKANRNKNYILTPIGQDLDSLEGSSF